ncbi:MAG: S-layer family protein [Phycisphaera sp. RhM]|nr:S-layer family protein [Phycisphaera sp. RhM]
MTATAGDVDGGATATAATLTINANGGIGIGTTFHSDAETLALTSAGATNAGNITIVEADTANLSVATAATAQTVDVTLTTGDLTISGAVGDANDNVNLTTSGGDVVGGATVTADTLTIDASGGIGIGTALDTDASTLDLTSSGTNSAGDITVVQATAANLMIATDTSGQTISITLTTGDFTVGGAIGDGNDSLSFIASDGDIVGGGTVIANDLTLNASGGIGIGTAVTANAATYSLTTGGTGTAGNITLVDTGALSTSQITTLVTAGTAQTIDLTATTGNLTVDGAIGQSNDDLNLTALAGDIVGGAATATANTLTLSASGGIGIGTALQADATSYSLTTTGVGNAGDIALVDTGAFNTNQITLLSTVASKQLVSLTATTGDLTIAAAIGNAVDDLTLVATAGDIVGGATATASTLTLNAGGGIGVGTAVTADATNYSLTTAGTGTDGNITLVDVAALNTNQITTLATDTSAQTISLTATTGNLTVGNAIGNGTDNLTLIATVGDVDGGATATATAETLIINAGGGIGNGIALMTDANTLNLVSSGFAVAGNITVIQADAANLSVATDASAQTIDVTLTTGDFTLGGAIGDASDSLSFTAADGDIVGGGTVTANTLTLDASGGIGIGTAVTANATTYHLKTLGAGVAGNITLVDTGAFNTNQIATLSTAASAQTISLTATTGDLTVGVATGNTTDHLSLIATAGDVIGGATATAATLTVNADGGIGIGGALNTNADTLNLTSDGAAANGNITVIQASAVNLSVDTAATGQTVDVTVSAGDLTISGPVGDANDDVNLTIQSGNVVGGSFAVTADTLTIDASGGIGIGVELDTDADTLDLTTHGVAVAGNISIVQADAANFSIATDTTGQTISVTLTTGDFTVGGAIGDGNDSLTFIANDGNIVGGGTVTANDLTLSASGGIGIVTAVTANAATYSLTTTGIGTDGNIRLVDTNGLNTNQITTLSTHSSTQTISLTASTGNLTVESSIGDANDHLSLISTLANIDGGATATAATLTLNAGGGIGIGAALTVDATSYSLTTAGVGTAGNITLVDANALNTNQITTLSTHNSVQTVSLTAAGGDLTVGSALGNATDNLTLITLAGNVEGGAEVTAETLAVNSSGGIGILTALETDVNTLDLTTDGTGATGDITVIQADASNLSIATDASGQTIGVTLTTGDFTIGGAIGDGNDSLTFIASAGDIVGGLGTVTANVLTLNASGGIGIGIGIGTAVTANANTYNLTTSGTNASGNITLIDTNALSTSDVTVATHGSTQTVDLTASTGNLTIDGDIGHSSDHLTLRASAGNIVGGAATATANTLTLIADGGIGTGIAVQADAANYALDTSGLAATGDIRLIDTNALSTSQVTLTTDASAQTVELTASTGNLLINNAIGNSIDNLTLNASVGDVVGGDLATANHLRLSAGGGIGIGAAVTADANTYHLTSSGNASNGDITLFDNNALNTNQVTVVTDISAQTVRLDALAGDLTVGGAIGNAIDNLTLRTSNGHVDGDGATVTAATLTVNSSEGIGITSVLITDVDTLNLTSGGIGAAGDIRVQELDATTYVVNTQASAQLIEITQSTGDITIGGAIGDGADSLTFIATAGNIEGGGTVTANALVLQAGGGIGTVAEITANATSYSLATFGLGTAGDIRLVDTNSLNTSQITNLSTGTTTQTVSLTASLGNLTVDAAIGEAGDNLFLNALVGNVEGGDTATAANLAIDAGGGIGIGATLNTHADTLNLTTSGVNGLGNITVVEADAVDLTITTAGSAQTVSAQVLDGNLTISNPIGDANDDLTLITSNGDVVGGGLVTADILTVDSSGGIGNGIPLQTDANTLDLTSKGIGAAGDISVVQADAANLAIATDASGQMISVTLTTGDFTVGGAIGDGNDSLMFEASAGNIIGGVGTVTANDLRLRAGGGIGITTPVTANAATYNLITEGIDANGNIELISVNTLNTDQVTLTTDGSTQTIDLSVSTGDLIVGGAIGDSMDNFNLNTPAGNIVGGGAAVSAATLTIVSSGGIGVGMALNTDADTLNLTTNGANAAGDITVIENNAVDLSIDTAASTQTASVTVSNGNLNVGGPIGDANDDLFLNTLNGDVNGDALGGATVTANNLTVNASGGIGTGPFLLTNANTLMLTSAGVDSAGNITVEDVGSANFMIGTDASSQTIDLTTRTGDFNIGGAIGDVNDNLRFTATTGDINGGGTVTANSLTLTAGRGIGAVTAVRANAASYSLTSSAAGAAGNISLVDTGPLNTSQITKLLTHGPSQTVTLTSETANLTVDSAIGNSADDLVLIATAGDVIGGGIAMAGTLRLVAAGGIGIGTALTSNATTYELSTTGVGAAGNIALVHQGAFNTSQLATLSTDASTQTIRLTASASNLTVDAAFNHPNDNLELIASGGAVQHTGATVTANALAVDAMAGIGLNTNVSSLTAINRVAETSRSPNPTPLRF